MMLTKILHKVHSLAVVALSTVSRSLYGPLIDVGFKIETEGTEQLLAEPRDGCFCHLLFSGSRGNFKSQQRMLLINYLYANTLLKIAFQA